MDTLPYAVVVPYCTCPVAALVRDHRSVAADAVMLETVGPAVIPKSVAAAVWDSNKAERNNPNQAPRTALVFIGYSPPSQSATMWMRVTHSIKGLGLLGLLARRRFHDDRGFSL